MNPLATHPRQQGVTYLEHWHFAMGIAYFLFTRAASFAVHAMLPFIPIEPRHDLEWTAAYLVERNGWIETAKRKVRADAQPDFALNDERRNAYGPENLNRFNDTCYEQAGRAVTNRAQMPANNK
ncbi:MAG: DUF6356 family protein [Pseudomonadota bacterium]|nr:DUF6356 family protein [Pseudomonadota bacterium]